MSDWIEDARPRADRATRRQFLVRLGAGAAALCGVSSLVDCGGETAPTTLATGTVNGSVTDQSGVPAAVGRIYLLESTGLNNNQYADVGPDGHFDFGPVPVGGYQLSYWGANLADVAEPAPNPVRIIVSAGQTTAVNFHVVLAASTSPGRDIYIGDYFFQEEPYGLPNTTVIVPRGTLVCWYNVGTMPHTVTGGPWGDSGPLALDGNFMWVADQVGTFAYRCSYHAPQMQAVLQVTDA
jgi:plastocyanin